MTIQRIWNLAGEMKINRRKMVGIQFTRSQLPRTDLSVTKNPWMFSVTVPGLPWANMRSIIESIDLLDRYQPETITIGNNPNFAWLYRYQGDRLTIPTGLTVSSFTGNQLVIGNITGLTNGQYLFRAGDMLQINTSPFPYTSTTDVLYTGAATVTVTTHRPNIASASLVGQTVNVGPNCQISVFCPNMPTYSLTPGAYKYTASSGIINNAIVNFDSDFQLYEWVTGA